MRELQITKTIPIEGDWQTFSSPEISDYMERQPKLPSYQSESLWTKSVAPQSVDAFWDLTFGEVCLAINLPPGSSQSSWIFPTATTRLYPASAQPNSSATKLREALTEAGQDCVVWVAFSLRRFRGDLGLGASAYTCCVEIESVAVNETYGRFTPYRGGLAHKGFLLAMSWAKHKARELFGRPIQWQCATDDTEAMKMIRNACLLWGFMPIREPARREVATTEDLDQASRLDRGKGEDKALAENAEILAKFTENEWVSTNSLQDPQREHLLPELRSFFKSARLIENSAAENRTFPCEFFISLKWGKTVGVLEGDAIIVVEDKIDSPKALIYEDKFKYWADERVAEAKESLGINKESSAKRIFARVNFSAHLLRKPTEPRRLTINYYERNYAYGRSNPEDCSPLEPGDRQTLPPNASDDQKQTCSLARHLFCLAHSLGELFTTLQPCSRPASLKRPLRVGLEPHMSRAALDSIKGFAERASASAGVPLSLPDKPPDSLIKTYREMGLFSDPRLPDFMRSKKRSVTKACKTCFSKALAPSGRASAPMRSESEPSEEDLASQQDASSASPSKKSKESSEELAQESSSEAEAAKAAATPAPPPKQASARPKPKGHLTKALAGALRPKVTAPPPPAPPGFADAEGPKPAKSKATARTGLAFVESAPSKASAFSGWEAVELEGPKLPKQKATALARLASGKSVPSKASLGREAVPPPPPVPEAFSRPKRKAAARTGLLQPSSKASGGAAPSRASASSGQEAAGEEEGASPSPELPLAPVSLEEIETADQELNLLRVETLETLKVVRVVDSMGRARIFTRDDVRAGDVLTYFLGFLKVRPRIKSRDELLDKANRLSNIEIRVHENEEFDACVAAYLQAPGRPSSGGPARFFLAPFKDPRFCGADIQYDVQGSERVNVGAFDVFCDLEDKLGLVGKERPDSHKTLDTARNVQMYRRKFGNVVFRKLPEEATEDGKKRKVNHRLYPSGKRFVTTLAMAPIVALKNIPRFTELIYDPWPIDVEGSESMKALRDIAHVRYRGSGEMFFCFDGLRGLKLL